MSRECRSCSSVGRSEDVCVLSPPDAFLRSGDSSAETSTPDTAETRVRRTCTLITASPLTRCLNIRGLSSPARVYGYLQEIGRWKVWVFHHMLGQNRGCGTDRRMGPCPRPRPSHAPASPHRKRRASGISSHPPYKRRGVPLTQLRRPP